MSKYDVAIIGGGPAGITASVYAARKGLSCLLLTKDFAGQVAQSAIVENYLGFGSVTGMELMQSFKKQLDEYDVDIKEKEVLKIESGGDSFVINVEGGSFESRTVIIASGGKPRKLDIPGEDEFYGKGVTYCPTCDGPLFTDRSVIVVGGGNSGLEAAIELSEYCKDVTIIERGAQLNGDEVLRERVKSRENIKVLVNSSLTKITGEKMVTGVEYEDGSGAKIMETDGVFIEIGYIPVSDFVDGLVELNEWNEIVVDHKTCQSSREGVFAAGDVTNVRDKQIVIAAGQGAIAAISAHKYLREGDV